jgi:hypothetical protein
MLESLWGVLLRFFIASIGHGSYDKISSAKVLTGGDELFSGQNRVGRRHFSYPFCRKPVSLCKFINRELNLLLLIARISSQTQLKGYLEAS